MPGSYNGRILWVDLTHRRIVERELDEIVARKYIGGTGLGAHILWEETTAKTDPLSPSNPLIFMTGPLTATAAPGPSRYMVVSLSPLTGIWGEAHSGGRWANELKCAGFDGIVCTGKSKEPVYLWVTHGHVEIRDAAHLWGKDTYEVSDILEQETAGKASVAAIGPAGEKLVRMACIMNDGRVGRAAARCGLGAVMGSKNLKAIAVRGDLRVKLSNEEGLKESVRNRYHSQIAYDVEKRPDKIKAGFGNIYDSGRTPIKNYGSGEFSVFREESVQAAAKGVPYYCQGCRYPCGESSMIAGVRRTVWEAMGPLGSQCLISDMDAVAEAYDLCNRLGLDSTSTGGAISFAMEVFEKGLITKVETEGIDLKWGNADAMVEMVRKIGLSEGFGKVLGEGARRASERIGGIAPEYAMHVKGLELPAHDPRASNFRALSYATSQIGACHQSAAATGMTRMALPDLGVPMDTPDIRFANMGKGELVAKVQDYICLINSLGVCRNAFDNGWRVGEKTIQPSDYSEWLNLATGWDMGFEEFMKCGERVFNLERLVNVRRGISRKDDTLPARVLTDERGGTSVAAHNMIPLGLMLSGYYAYRGWSKDGIPTARKLEELGLKGMGDSLGRIIA